MNRERFNYINQYNNSQQAVQDSSVQDQLSLEQYNHPYTIHSNNQQNLPSTIIQSYQQQHGFYENKKSNLIYRNTKIQTQQQVTQKVSSESVDQGSLQKSSLKHSIVSKTSNNMSSVNIKNSDVGLFNKLPEQEINVQMKESYIMNKRKELLQQFSKLSEEFPQDNQNEKVNSFEDMKVNQVSENQFSQSKLVIQSKGLIHEIKEENEQTIIQHGQQGHENCESYRSNTSSKYLSNPGPQLQLMKNFIQSKSREVADLQNYLVKEFEQMETQKSKFKSIETQLSKTLSNSENLKQENRTLKQYIAGALKELFSTQQSCIREFSKKYIDQIHRIHKQKDLIIQHKTQRIGELESQLAGKLRQNQRVRVQQQLDEYKQRKLLYSKSIKKIDTPDQKLTLKGFKDQQTQKKQQKKETKLGDGDKQFEESDNSKSRASTTSIKSKQKKGRYEYFRHFQQQLQKQKDFMEKSISPKSILNSENQYSFNVHQKQSKEVVLQIDYENRLQRLLKQKQMRQSILQKELKLRQKQVAKQPYYLKDKTLNSFSPLKQAKQINKRVEQEPRGQLVKTKSTSMLVQRQGYQNKPQESNAAQVWPDRKQCIKQKIERLRHRERDDEDRNEGRQEIRNERSRTPIKNQNYSPVRRGHARSTYIEGGQNIEEHPYCKPVMRGNYSKLPVKHSNSVYQYSQYPHISQQKGYKEDREKQTNIQKNTGTHAKGFGNHNKSSVRF